MPEAGNLIKHMITAYQPPVILEDQMALDSSTQIQYLPVVIDP